MAFVQGAFGVTDQVTSTVTATLGATPADGSTLVAVYVARESAGTDPTLAGWDLVKEIQVFDGGGGDNGSIVVFRRTAGASEPTAVTVTKNGSFATRLWVGNYSGTWVFDDEESESTTSSVAALGTGPISPSSTPALLVGAIIQSNESDLTIGGGFTERDMGMCFGAQGPTLIVGDREVSSAGPFEMLATSDLSDSYAGVVVSFTGTAPPPPDPGDHLVVYDPDGTELVEFTNLLEQSTRIELDGTGSGRFVISKHDSQATAANLARGNTVRVTYGEIDPNPIFEFIIEEGDFQVISGEEEGGEELTFGGPGTLAVLKRALNDYREWDPDLTPPPSGNIKPALGIWRWNNTAAGGVFGRMVHEAFMRGVLGFVTRTFGTTLDSDLNAWPVTGAWQIPIGSNVYDEMMKLIAAGWFHVQMRPGYLLDAFISFGEDRTGTSFGPGVVRFVKGVNIADELQRRVYGREWASHVMSIGTDGNYHTSALGSYPYVVEKAISVPSNDEDDLSVAGLAALDTAENSQNALTFRARLPNPGDDPDDDEGLYYPGPAGTENGRYWVGDLVTIHSGTGEFDFDNEDHRIYAITLTIDETGALAEPIIEINAPAPDDEGIESSLPPSQGGGSSGGTVGFVPHTHSNYQVTSEKGEDSGYASLDADGQVPAAELGTGTPSVATVLRGDQTWRLDKLDATADPAVTDDSGDGYSIGSRWINVTTDDEWVCTDASVGAAVWVLTTATGGGGGDLDDLGDVDTTGVADGDVLAFDDSDDTWKPVAPSGGGGGGDYVLIETAVLGSAAADITIDSIPDTYRDLIIVAVVRCAVSARNADLLIRFGTGGTIDTGNNYEYAYHITGSDGHSAGETTAQNSGWIGRCTGNTAAATRHSRHEMRLLDYAVASDVRQGTWDSAHQDNDNRYTVQGANAWYGDTDDPVDIVRIFVSGQNLMTGSRLSIYGRN